jgi:hypothetical protein
VIAARSPDFDGVARLVAEQTGMKPEQLAPETELERDLGVLADDFHELMRKFAERFGTDMSGYRWYFHTGEEGPSPGGLFFAPPYRRVEQIPVTLQMLVDSARAGKWLVEYPPHALPRMRWDILINQLLVGGFLVFLVVRCAT